MLALCGAERTGKSTLARAYAEERGLIYIPSRASEIFRSMDLPVGPLEPSLRLEVQERILAGWVADVEDTRQPWIADRSPIDMAVYTVMDLVGAGVDEKRVKDYVQRCFDLTNKHVAALIILQPGIPYVEEEGKPAKCLVRQSLFSMAARGMAANSLLTSPCYVIKESVIDLKERIATVDSVVESIILRASSARGEAVLH